jgi:valyl-tRNA synthetase
LADPDQARAVDDVIALVGAIRNARQEAGIEPGRWLEGSISTPATIGHAVLAELRPAVERLARLRPLRVDMATLGTDRPPDAKEIVAVAGGFEARVRMDGVTGGPTSGRLARELAETEEALARAEARLADPLFTSRAPAAVVEGTRRKVAELRERVERLRARAM